MDLKPSVYFMLIIGPRLLPIHLQEGEGPHLIVHLMLNMKMEINNNNNL